MKSNLFALALVAALTAGCASDPNSRTVGEVVDDVSIGTQLKAKYAADPDISALKVNIDTREGAVSLRGEVKSLAIRRKAEAMAREIKGVKSVDNQLVIAP
ncbi:BON domain-containing protein [Piscinibacter koreensis]|uniref:BON domain-containing protein n=1 Tax=Piscinibacter koreensis TaxID=2742824 RepID=A0A7Y6NMC7_9BURK|nr:BON domain-containing protein [Schlegelella koreensis]NUZ05802.1 BON domain-containing protein [Schlegelella koreensis]